MSAPGEGHHEQIEAVRIIRWGRRGDGLGQAASGKELSVAGAIPSEIVEVRILGEGQRRAWGVLESIPQASPERVSPPCDLAGPCGGCPWMHLSYAAQLRHKASLVEDALGSALPREAHPPIAAATPSPATVGYRRRASLVFGGAAGRLSLGAYRPRSHELLDVGRCPVTDPSILEARDHLLAVLNTTDLSPWDERRGQGILRHATFQSDPDTGSVFVVLVVGHELPARPDLSALVQGDGGIIGVALSVNGARGNRILGRYIRPWLGADGIDVTLYRWRMRLPPGAFSQVNLDAAALLYAWVEGQVGQGEQLLDLYCGVGALALNLAPRFSTVVGVEVHEGAVAAATSNAQRLGFTHTRFEQGDVAQKLAAIPRCDEEVIVVNPPRRGLSAEVRGGLISRRPRRLVYVSCGPHSLASDLGSMVAHGFAVDSIRCFDLFPHTHHVETVVSLQWRGM